MQFEIQGQSYLLKFHPGEGRWYLLTPTPLGFAGVPVLDDSTPATGTIFLPDEQEDEQHVIN